MPDSPQDLPFDDDEMKKAQAELDLAQRRFEEVRARSRDKVLADLRERIQLYALTAEELGFTVQAPKRVPMAKTVPVSGSPAKAADGRSVVQTKYIGPNGERWSGRGKTPAWLSEQIALGRTKEDFSVSRSQTGGQDD